MASTFPADLSDGSPVPVFLQHREQNVYRDDLEDIVADGLLSHLGLAFSRDQGKRIYVQHKMIEHSAQVWR